MGIRWRYTVKVNGFYASGCSESFPAARPVAIFLTAVLSSSASLDKHIDMSSAWETLGLLIKHIQHRTLLRLEAKLAPLGISMIQWNALRTIDRYPGSCLHRLAALTFNSDQAFGTLATRLRRRGLIERRPGAGRASLHGLTPKGEALLKAGRSLVQEVLSVTFGSPQRDREQGTGHPAAQAARRRLPHRPVKDRNSLLWV